MRNAAGVSHYAPWTSLPHKPSSSKTTPHPKSASCPSAMQVWSGSFESFISILSRRTLSRYKQVDSQTRELHSSSIVRGLQGDSLRVEPLRQPISDGFQSRVQLHNKHFRRIWLTESDMIPVADSTNMSRALPLLTMPDLRLQESHEPVLPS